jgi:hypothetical protein
MINILMPVISKVLDRLIPDKEANAKAKRELEKTLIDNMAQINIEQIKTNQQEAQHRTLWVSGWRPFIGWVCGSAMAWHFIAAPLITFIAIWSGAEIPAMPTFDMGSLMTVLMGLLGLGGMRTFEKMKGLTK